MYKIIYSPKAIEDLQKLKRSEPAAYKKADKFIKELKEHLKRRRLRIIEFVW